MEIKDLKDRHFFVQTSTMEKAMRTKFSYFTHTPINIYSAYALDKKEFNKPLFFVYNGMLRQFKVKKEFISPFGRVDGGTCTFRFGVCGHFLHAAFLLDVAGIGEMWVGADSYNTLPFDVFESESHFKNEKTYDVCYKKWSVDIIKDLYERANVCTFDENRVACRYKWNGTSVQKLYTTDINYGLIWDGCVNNKPLKDSQCGKGYYLSEEECKKDNSIQVAYLDGEEKPKEEKLKMVVILGVEYEVTEEEFKKIKAVIGNKLV